MTLAALCDVSDLYRRRMRDFDRHRHLTQAYASAKREIEALLYTLRHIGHHARTTPIHAAMDSGLAGPIDLARIAR